MPIFIIIVGLFAIAFNAAASFAIMRSSIYTNKQKIWQALIVWVIPFVGAAVAWFIHKETTHIKSPTTKDHIHDESSWDIVPPPPHREDSAGDHGFDAHD